MVFDINYKALMIFLKSRWRKWTSTQSWMNKEQRLGVKMNPDMQGDDFCETTWHMKCLSPCLLYMLQTDSRWGATQTADLLSEPTQLIFFFLAKQDPARLKCSRRATRHRRIATFRLNALMACRLRSATEHHTLQHAGPVAWKEKRQQDAGDEEALCPWPAVRDTKALWEQHKTYCYSDRKSRFFFLFFWDTASLCACLRGTHSIMRRIWVDTSHSRSIAGVEEVGRWIIQAASAAQLWRLVVSYGEVRGAGNNKQHLLARRPSHDSPRMEHPRNLDFPEDRASFQRAAAE